ncbi:MAG TPA: hypothetical protein DCZ49_01335, partial [Hyphomonadaceae bacterium]|nr:hypothetical protein [Hyphomonadaceae bacterium]
PDPVAYAGTDRNFYDRYFFNGYSPDGSTFFAAAFGVYPHLDVADAHFCVVRDGVQHCLHASRRLGMERMELTCGPIRIAVLEPLQSLRVTVAGEGIAADPPFSGRAFPIEEPRFTWRVGPRTVMDYTRLTQNGHYAGWIEVDGVRAPLAAGYLLGLAHITGGGLIGNAERMLPPGLDLRIDWQAWRRPALFDWLQGAGDVPEDDMRQTFNLGIGMVAIVKPQDKDRLIADCARAGVEAVLIGDLIAQ